MNNRIRKVFDPTSSSYTISAEISMHVSELGQETEFVCEVYIPGTPYVIKESTNYYKGEHNLFLEFTKNLYIL